MHQGAPYMVRGSEITYDLLFMIGSTAVNTTVMTPEGKSVGFTYHTP